MRNYKRPRILLFGLAALLPALAEAGTTPCPPLHHIDWPADHPVWSMCWISPDASSGIDGSGLELRDVSYKGKRVFERAGIPLLTVDYDAGGCGSYRDWQRGLMTFEADGALGPPGSLYAEPGSPPQTMCNHPGTDAGDFAGVAAEKTASQLVLTTQLQAGPYRYTQKWTFRPDGSMDARIAFTSRVDPCNIKPHNHHAYWRMELDIGGDGRDTAEEARPATGGVQWSRVPTETSRRSDPGRGLDWRIRSESAQRGYEIVSSPENGVADSWAVADLWILAAHADEIDDGGARKGPGGSAVQLNAYLNGESINGSKLVVWVHAMDRHEDSGRCHFVGPSLRPFGNW